VILPPSPIFPFRPLHHGNTVVTHSQSSTMHADLHCLCHCL